MIAKISKGGSFGGAVDYVLDKGKDAELLAGLGVRMKDRDSIVRSFRMQAALNPHLSKPVGHIVLAFSAQDAARLDNRRMVGIAAEYLSGMGIRNTQFIIARHRDREHPHLHILFNRVDNDGRTVSDRNDLPGSIGQQDPRTVGGYLAGRHEVVVVVERIRVDRDRHFARVRPWRLDGPRFEVVQSSGRKYVHGAVGHGVDPRTNDDFG